MKESSFAPNLFGCVGRNPGLARTLNRLRAESFAILGDCLLFAVCFEEEPQDGALFEELATRETEDFRLLARLIRVLGGEEAPRLQVRLGGIPFGYREPTIPDARRAIEAVEERNRKLCSALERIILHCDDAVVRATLAYLLERRQIQPEEIKKRLH